MANKTIKIEAEMSPKVSPKMEKMMKTYAELGAKAANPKDLAKYNKEMDKTIKYAEKWVKLTKEQTKAMREGPLKAMQDQDKLLQQIGKRMEVAQMRMGKADEAGREWMYRKLASTGITAQSDPAGYARLQRTSEQITANVRNRAQGDMDVGMDIFRQQREKMDDEKQQRRMENIAKAMAVGAGVKVLGQTIGTAGEIFFGQSMRKAQFGSEAAGFAGKMYNDLTSGDFTGLAAMMRNPESMAQFREIVGDAKGRSITNQVGAGVGAAGGIIMGGAQTVLGAGMTLSGAGAGMGPMNLAGGVGSLVGGVGELGMVAANAAAGKTQADVSSAAIQGMEYMKALDPIRLRQMQELQGRTRQIAEFGVLQGVTGDPSLKMAEMQRMGMAGGISSLEETMGYYQALRGVTSGKSAMEDKNLLAVTQAPLAGIGREAMIQGMGATARMAGGTGDAGGQMFNLMRKAMAMGIDDSRLREAIVTTLPSLLENGMGREAGMGNVFDAMSIAKTSAANRGGELDLRDIELGVAATKIGGQLTGGASGIPSLDVAMMGAGINQGSAIRKKHKGFTSDIGMAFAAMGMDQLNKNAATDALFRDAGITDPDAQAEILSQYRATKGNKLEEYAKGSGMKKSAILLAIAKEKGWTYEQAEAAYSGTTRGENARKWDRRDLPENAGMHAIGPGSVEWFGTAQTQAQVMGAPTQAALTDEENKKNLRNSVEAAGAFVTHLERLSQVGNLDAIKDVPGLVLELANNIDKLGNVAAKANGGTRGATPSVPGTVQPPKN